MTGGGKAMLAVFHNVGACEQYCESIFIIASEKCPTRLAKFERVGRIMRRAWPQLAAAEVRTMKCCSGAGRPALAPVSRMTRLVSKYTCQ